MLILLVRGVIDLGDALLDHDMQPQVQVRGQEVHAAKSVNEPIDVQVQPGVEDDERRLQRHKDNHEEAGGRPHGLVTGISRLILQDGDLGCNSIDILGLAQFCAQNLAQNVAQVLSDRNTGILDLTLLGPTPIHLAQFCGPVSSPVEV